MKIQSMAIRHCRNAWCGKPFDLQPGPVQLECQECRVAVKRPHICLPEHAGLSSSNTKSNEPSGMRALYAKLGVYPSSDNGADILIRSHVAYWTGSDMAQRIEITPSRGYTYRVKRECGEPGIIVKIVDDLDHRNGVTGWRSA